MSLSLHLYNTRGQIYNPGIVKTVQIHAIFHSTMSNFFSLIFCISVVNRLEQQVAVMLPLFALCG